MSYWKTDLADINFNLFKVLNSQEFSSEMGDTDLAEILRELDKFSENEIWPARMPSDEQGCHLTAEGVKVPEVLKNGHNQFYANGWYALGVKEDFGGMEVPEAVNFAGQSIINAANSAWAMYPGLTKAAMNVIIQKGSDKQKEIFVTKMMEGSFGGTMCLTEAGAGSDVGALRTTATPNDDGSYNINGVKIFISSGENDLYENIVHLVLARTPDAPAGTKGLSLFVVPRYLVNEDGSNGASNDVICTKVEEKMGIHCNATCELTFGQNGNCKGELIGEIGEGMSTMFIMMNEARLLCGIQGEGQAHIAYEMSKKYASERVQFGTEIDKHMDIKRMLLKMRANTRGMRALCLYTANCFDIAHKDENYEKLIALLTPICKAYCSEEGFNVSVDALQIHGGYGFCTEYGIEQFVRDTKITTIYEGTNGIQALDFVMRKVLKDQGATLKFMTGLIMSFMGKLDDDLSTEKALFEKVLGSAQTVMDKFAKKAMDKDFNGILQHCTDFLLFSSQLVIAWRLGESALKAQEMLPSASGEEKKFLESKIVDFKTYCGAYLIHNLSIAKTITDYEQNLASLEL